MWKEKPGRPERPEVLGVIDDLEGVARELAGASKGGTPPIVIMEDGDSPPRMGKRTSERGTNVNAVYVGRAWVHARMEEELKYRRAFYEWLYGVDPKGRVG